MKQSLSQALRRMHLPMMLLLSAAPLALVPLCRYAPDILSRSWAFAAAYAPLCALCLSLPGRRRLIGAGLSTAALLLLGAALLPLRTQPMLALLPIGTAVLLLFALPMAVRYREADISPFFYAAGVAAHVASQALLYTARRGGVYLYEPVASALTALFVLYLLLLLLAMNRISLDNATMARYHAPASMRRLNTVLTLAFMALAALLSCMPAVVSAVIAAWQALRAAFAAINDFLINLLPQNAGYGGALGGGMGLMELGTVETEPSRFAEVIEKIASAIAAVILVVGGALVLRLLLAQLIRLPRCLWRQLHRYVSAASGEYDDEITDTRESGAARENRLLRRAKRRAAPEHADTPAGRIRLAYARLLRRHPRWSESSTARENLPAEAAALYERARYSRHPVAREDAERFSSGVRRL